MRAIVTLTLFSIVFICLFSCNTPDIKKNLRVGNAERILGGDSAKVWLRSARFEDGNRIVFNDCQDEERIVFVVDGGSNLIYRLGEQVDCTSSISVTDTTINGSFTVLGDIDDIITDTIIVTDPQTIINPWVVRGMTSRFLEFLYIENIEGSDREVVEQFIF